MADSFHPARLTRLNLAHQRRKGRRVAKVVLDVTQGTAGFGADSSDCGAGQASDLVPALSILPLRLLGLGAFAFSPDSLP